MKELKMKLTNEIYDINKTKYSKCIKNVHYINSFI